MELDRLDPRVDRSVHPDPSTHRDPLAHLPSEAEDLLVDSTAVEAALDIVVSPEAFIVVALVEAGVFTVVAVGTGSRC